MSSKDETGQLTCSFCGKSQDEVKKLIAGPTVYICDECIELCNDIIDEEARLDDASALKRSCRSQFITIINGSSFPKKTTILRFRKVIFCCSVRPGAERLFWRKP